MAAGSGQRVPSTRLATKAARSQAGSHVAGERPRWIGTPCRMKLDIYLVSCGREGEKWVMEGEEQRERQREEGKKWGEGRDRSCHFERETERRDSVGLGREWAWLIS